MGKKTFPKNFLWGASSSAHQSEANLLNDWKIWEKENAEKLAKNYKNLFVPGSKLFHQVPNFDEFPQEVSDPKNYISGITVDFRNHYKQDLKLAKALGHNAFRFSIAWEDINPEPGVFNDEAANFYKELINYLHELEIEPLVTLWHYSLPLWFSQQDAWLNKKSPRLFSEYVRYLLKQKVLDKVKYIITINEPMGYLVFSFIGATRPPQSRSFRKYQKAKKNIIKGHKLAYNALKKHNKNYMISVAKSIILFEVINKNPINNAIKKISDNFFNYKFLRSISNHLDYIGLNYYFHTRINFGLNKYKTPKASDLGWGLYPEGIYKIALELKQFNLPIIVTEHGLADRKDKHRAWYIEETIKQLKKANDEGLDIQGYLHWSLTDNFEWDYGAWPRFGLIEVDYKTQKRTVRKSAYTYQKLIKKHQC